MTVATYKINTAIKNDVLMINNNPSAKQCQFISSVQVNVILHRLQPFITKDWNYSSYNQIWCTAWQKWLCSVFTMWSSLSRTMLKSFADLSVNCWETSPKKAKSRFWRYNSILPHKALLCSSFWRSVLTWSALALLQSNDQKTHSSTLSFWFWVIHS